MVKSINDKITIYLNDKGIKKVKEIIKERNLDIPIGYQIDIDEYLEIRLDSENGFTEQMWYIIENYHELFFNGSNYIQTSKFII